MNAPATPMDKQQAGKSEFDTADYWYINRHELAPGQVFRTGERSVVMLDRSVPGDGTKWYVADWYGYWSYEDSTIEPGDLTGAPIENTPAAIAAALASSTEAA